MENPLGGIMFGAIAIAVGLYFKKQGKAIESDYIKTTGMVIGNKEGDDLSFPVVEFLDNNNEKVSATLNTGYRPAKGIGTNMNIAYHKEDSAEVVVESSFLYKTLPIVLYVVGGLFAAYNIYDLLRS